MKDILDKAVKGGFPEKDAENILLIMATGNDELKEIVFNFVVLSHDFLKASAIYLIDSGRAVDQGIDIVKNNLAVGLVLSEDRKGYLHETMIA